MKEYQVKVYNHKTEWFNLNGLRHREDGPAIEWANGTKFWYLNGQYLTEAEFNQRAKPTCSGKVVEIDGKKYKLTEL
jgi:protein associated with RNAse G/E